MTLQRDIQDSGGGNNLQKIFQTLAGQLYHDDIVPTTNLSCDLTWLETYMRTLEFREAALERCHREQLAVGSILQLLKMETHGAVYNK